MRFLVVLVALGALFLPPSAGAATVAVRPSADVGLPFWCDWGYDWEERCYVDDGQRLPVGGVDDKVWRAALRFPLGRIPATATITSARVRLVHDGRCVAPRLRTVPCEGGSFWLDAHRIVSAHVRVRRPRLSAQGGGGPGGGDLRPSFPRPPDARGRARAVPRPPGRGHGSGGEAAADRRGIYPRLRGGGEASWQRALSRPGHALLGRDRVGRDGRP